MERLQVLQTLPWITYLIPMTLIVLGFVVVCWAIYWEFRKRELEYTERRLMIERGMTPPPMERANQSNAFIVAQQLRHDERRLMLEKGITPPSRKPWQPRQFLLVGTILFFLGIGLGIASFQLAYAGDIADGAIAGSWGASIGMIGLACLVYYLLTKDKQ